MKTLTFVCTAAWLALLGCGRTPVQPDPRLDIGNRPGAPEVRGDAAADLRLPAHVQPTAYRATVRVDPAEPGFTGRVEIDLRVLSPSRVIWLHAERLEVDHATATVGGEVLALSPRKRGDDEIGLHAPRLLVGAVTVALTYRGQQDESGTAGLFREREDGDWYSFTHFEPIFARRVFPSIDEPDRKTPWTMALEIPAGLTALANTRQVDEAPAGHGWKRVTFAQTRPLPPHLIAFAVGPFEIADAGKSRTGVPIRIVALRGKLRRTALSAEVFPRALALLEDYFDVPYPYDKLDLVPIPITVGFLCMENPGLVTCTEEAMLFDPATPTRADRRTIAHLAAHELAHQWLGNLVTPAWWDDLWLNEGLATWIEDRITSAIDPRPDDVFAAAENHAAALAADARSTARAVRQPIKSSDDIHSAFDSVTYAKAGAVIAMFERSIGERTFQRGLRTFVKKHADGVATTADLLAAIAEAGGRDIAGLSTFLDQPGAPRLSTRLRCGDRAGKAARPVLAVQQSVRRDAKGQRWQIPFCFAYDRDGKRGETCAVLQKDYALIVLDTKSCPRWVMPNAGGLGHYRLTMTREMVDQAITTGWSQMTPVERVVLADAIRGMVGPFGLEVDLAMALIPRLLREDNRVAIELAAGLASVRSAMPEADMAAYDRWLVRTFGGEARRLGWLPHPGEPPDFPLRRQALLTLVAEAGDPVLRKESLELAARWRELPRDARQSVLMSAIRADANGTLFRRLRADALLEKDRETRGDLFAALAATRDPGRVAKVLELLLDPRVDMREIAWLPEEFWREPERTQAETFVRKHLDALLARYPHDSKHSGGSPFTRVFTSACNAARRDEIAAFVRATFAALPGGPRDVAQRIEAMDACIAWRAWFGPQLARWLATVDAR